MTKSQALSSPGRGRVTVGATKTKRSTEDELKVWVTKLVTQQNDVVSTSTSKAERIEKRLAKKRRIDEAKQKLQSKKKKPLLPAVIPPIDAREEQLVKRSLNEPINITDDRINLSRSPQQSKIQLSEFSEKLERCLELIKEKRKSWQKRYIPAPVLSVNTSKRRRQQLVNNMENWYQPQRSNYGGIGLARPSLFIALDDPSWQAKLEEEFLEHVPGFFGKQRTKAMKKQLDGQMLWRQLQNQKLVGSSSSLSRKNPSPFVISGKKLSHLKPDERVEALIRAGYI